MTMSDEMVAMILAGGQGTRLGALTRNTAKPAVPFGGKYRLIDYTLSNCANSGINHVGIITQYQPFELNAHIGNGSPWGLNARGGSATILQPYSNSEGGNWFMGTADAIYQNMSYLDNLNPEYVLVLSGDHIYKMDYSKMLAYHIENNADLTISVLPVSMKEASRFGIMNTDDKGRVVEFEEKPAKPKSNLASMGIYIFNWQLLRQYLVSYYNSGEPLTDFGKDVIPLYLQQKHRCFAYSFHGYWKDVGTIDSLWAANMEVIDPEHELSQNPDEWRIYTHDPDSSAQYIGPTASTYDSIISDGCSISGTVLHAVLSNNVQVSQSASVEHSVVMSGVTIGEGAIVRFAIVGENAKIDPGAKIIGKPGAIEVIGYSERVRG